MRKRGTLFSIILISIFLSIPNIADANTKESPVLKMEELAIQVMPEYSFHPGDKKKDHPSLLVGYHGTLLNQSNSPQKGQIEIPLPMKTEDFKIGYVADYSRDQTEMNEIQYEINKDKQTISWTTTAEIQPGELYKFVIEFYTNQIKANKETKELFYTFESFADIGMVRVIFLEPLKTDSFVLTPAAETHQENSYGMNMFMYQFQGMKVHDKKEFSLQYKRGETKPTVDIMNEMAAQSTAGGKETKNEPVSNTRMIWIFVAITSVVAILLLILLKKKVISQTTKATNNQTDMIDPLELKMKKKDLRKRLLEGTISEEKYNELLRNL